MLTRSLSRALVGVALAAALPAPVSGQPEYARRLGLPVLGDAIGYPRGVTADPHTGELFVCDTRMNRILIFDQEGLFRHGIPGGDVFVAPLDLAVDPEGYILVAASYERRSALLELDFDGLFLREVALSLPEDAVPPRIASVALSPTGDRVFVIDTDNQNLWIVGRDGALVGAVDLAPGLAGEDRFDVILGKVDVYGDTVLVGVPSGAQVRVFDLDGTPRGVFGRRGNARCMTAFPVAAALNNEGELVIIDQQRMVLLRWNTQANRCLDEYLSVGNSPGLLYYPMDLALDRSGQILISQGYQGRVQMYSGMAPAAPLPRAP